MSIVLVGARLLVGDGSEIDDAVVEFENGRITSAGRAPAPTPTSPSTSRAARCYPA